MLIKTRFKGLFLIKNKKFKDKRGYFKEILKEKDIRKKFPFLVMSFSKKNVIRGIHIQNVNPQGKYISILKGKIFDVALDLRKDSRTFGKYFSSVLSEKNLKSIYIPPGFAHGFCTLEDNCDVAYKCTNYYSSECDANIRWNDPTLNIKWDLDTDRVIVFFRQKKEAHRARVIFGLSGLKATELHGSMSQEQVSVIYFMQNQTF